MVSQFILGTIFETALRTIRATGRTVKDIMTQVIVLLIYLIFFTFTESCKNNQLQLSERTKLYLFIMSCLPNSRIHVQLLVRAILRTSKSPSLSS